MPYSRHPDENAMSDGGVRQLVHSLVAVQKSRSGKLAVQGLPGCIIAKEETDAHYGMAESAADCWVRSSQTPSLRMNAAK